MNVFGYYREDAFGIDMSFAYLLPKPKEYILLGEKARIFKELSGYIYGFKGVILRYGELETGPIFISDSGFFSDSIHYLYKVGIPPDYENCKRFIERGDYPGFTPLKYTKRVGGRVRIVINGGIRFEVVGEGGVEINKSEFKGFLMLPKLYGKFWFIKFILMDGEKRDRALTVESWFYETHSS
mgnify:CR=1 FL=1